jgi:hypothetical protein
MGIARVGGLVGEVMVTGVGTARVGGLMGEVMILGVGTAQVGALVGEVMVTDPSLIVAYRGWGKSM